MFLLVVVLGISALVFLLNKLVDWSLPSPSSYAKLQKIPGPKGQFLVGNLNEVISLDGPDILVWLQKNKNEYKRMMRMWVLGNPSVYLFQPSDIQCLLNSVSNISKGVEYASLLTWLNNGLLTSTGDIWHGRRKMLTPTFHFKILEEVLPSMDRQGKLLGDKLLRTKGRPVDLDSFITLCTLDVIAETAMGVKLNAQNNEGKDYVSAIKRITEVIMTRTLSPWLYKDIPFFISSLGREFLKLQKFLHNFGDKVIKDRKVNFKNSPNGEIKKGQRRAFLDSLLEVEARAPGTLSDVDIREEVETFMFEGHDTTSAALTYLFFSLANNPEIQERVHAELDEIYCGEEEDSETKMKDLQRMAYLERVIKETLRLYPSVPYLSRVLEKEIVLEGGVVLPERTNVAVVPFLVHRDEELFPEPERFDPDRFLEDSAVGRHPFAYIPFSAGPRNCIGQKFAMLELKMVAASVLRRLKVEPITTLDQVTLVPSLILRTKEPIYCKFVRRRPSDEILAKPYY